MLCRTALCSPASSTGSRPPHVFGVRTTDFHFLGRTRLFAFVDPGRSPYVVESFDFCTGLCHKDPDLWLKEGACPTSSIGAGRWRRSRGTVVTQQNLRQQTRKARGVPPVKKEGPGESHVKQGEPFEGKRGQRLSAAEQFRRCAPVRLTEPGPRKPHHLTAVAVGHVRTPQGPCTT